LPSGIAKGRILPRKDFERMLREYYEIREWDVETGIPKYEKLEKMGLEDVAERLRRASRL